MGGDTLVWLGKQLFAEKSMVWFRQLNYNFLS